MSEFDCYVRDVFQHIDQVTAVNSGIPVFMLGHSMVSILMINNYCVCSAAFISLDKIISITSISFDKSSMILYFSSIQGGTIAILSVMDRPDFFTGAIFSAPAAKVDPTQATNCMVRNTV